jgi:hypothetical protein
VVPTAQHAAPRTCLNRGRASDQFIAQDARSDGTQVLRATDDRNRCSATITVSSPVLAAPAIHRNDIGKIVRICYKDSGDAVVLITIQSLIAGTTVQPSILHS